MEVYGNKTIYTSVGELTVLWAEREWIWHTGQSCSARVALRKLILALLTNEVHESVPSSNTRNRYSVDQPNEYFTCSPRCTNTIKYKKLKTDKSMVEPMFIRFWIWIFSILPASVLDWNCSKNLNVILIKCNSAPNNCYNWAIIWMVSNLQNIF